MKIHKLILLLVLCSRSLLGQNTSPNQHALTPEEMIKSIIEEGAIEGVMQKQIGQMGDAAAVAITKVFAGRDLTTSDVDTALVILTYSFAGPESVQIEADRQPRTALLLLRYFDCSIHDPRLKQDIARTKKYLEEHYQKSLLPAK